MAYRKSSLKETFSFGKKSKSKLFFLWKITFQQKISSKTTYNTEYVIWGLIFFYYKWRCRLLSLGKIHWRWFSEKLRKFHGRNLQKCPQVTKFSLIEIFMRHNFSNRECHRSWFFLWKIWHRRWFFQYFKVHRQLPTRRINRRCHFFFRNVIGDDFSFYTLHHCMRGILNLSFHL